jgi:hypothetical protein
MYWVSLLVAIMKGVLEVSRVLAQALLCACVLTESRGRSMCASYNVLELKVYWALLHCSWMCLLFAKVRALEAACHLFACPGAVDYERVCCEDRI